jgi:DNA polymerase-3 subunit delta'
MAQSLEHPDVHWYFPLPRPKNVSGDRLRDALETARMEALASRREQPLRPSHTDEVQGLYLGTVKNIRGRAHMRATMAAGPVFIIGDADLLVPQEASPEAANALLKLLEEPPGEARFILTSSEAGRLLPTIRSRTVPLQVSALDPGVISRFVQDTLEVEPRTAEWAAALGRGSLGRTLGFLPDGDEPGPLESLRRRAFKLVEVAIKDGGSEGYGVALGFPPAGARRLVDLFAFVEEWLRDLGAVASGAVDRVFNQDTAERLSSLVESSAILAADVPRALPAVERALELARGNVNPQLVVSGLIRDLRQALIRPAAGALR